MVTTTVGPHRDQRAHLASTMRGARSSLAPVALVLFLISGWEIGLRVFNVEAFLFPTPSDIARSLSENRAELLSNAGVTSLEIGLGFTISITVGVLVALGLHLSKTAYQAVFPLLIASQAIPIVVVAPVLVVLMGFGIGPKLTIVGLICFFPVVVTTVDGLRSADPTMTHMMRTLYAGRWDILRRVEIPNALPSFFTGARISATYAAIGAIFGEWAGASSGLGFFIQQRAAGMQTADVFAAVLVVCTVSFLLLAIVTIAERVVVPWSPKARSRTTS